MTLKTDILADLSDVFFNTDEFADSAILNGTTTISVIFDNGFAAAQGVEATAPTALCISTDVASVAHNNTLEIDGTTYYVVGIQPNGDTTLLILSEEQA